MIAVLEELRVRGIVLRVVGAKLRYRPATAAPAELRDRIMACKPELVRVVEYFEERAAIREYEGGFARDEAERLAWQDVTCEATT